MSGWWLLRCPLWGVLGRVGYVNWEQQFSSVCHHGLFKKKSELHISVFHIYYLSDVKNQGKSTFTKFPIFFRMVRTVGDVGAQGAAKSQHFRGPFWFSGLRFSWTAVLGACFSCGTHFYKTQWDEKCKQTDTLFVYEKRDVARCHATRCHLKMHANGFCLMDLNGST